MFRTIVRAMLVVLLVVGVAGMAPAGGGADPAAAATAAPVFVRAWGTPGTGAGTFNSPRGVAVLASMGYVYVADPGNHLV